jgi:DNA-binding NarL/FixJ family response regulator
MRIAIVEDDPLFLEKLLILLNGEKGITVADSYSDAEDALQSLEESQPEIMLVDLGLPGMSGVDLIRKVKAKMPSIEIIVHTVSSDKESVFAAIKAGASGYILKGCPPRELIESIFTLYRGGAPMSPRIARKILSEFREDAHISDQHLLSQKEKAVVECMEDGLTYKEISDRLNMSVHTVHSHIKHIYETLHAKGRQEALNKARQKGIL